MNTDRTPQHIKLDERNHVEKPLLNQLSGLDWEILDLDNKQHPGATYRKNFTEVVMLPVLREQLKVINDWLEPNWNSSFRKPVRASAFPSRWPIASAP